MTPYVTGTVTLTEGSSLAVGQGTGWAIGLVAGGVIASGGACGVIASVQSDTALTLAGPWAGPSLVAAPYQIAREGAEAARAVWANDRLADIIATMSVSGITPNGAGALAARPVAPAEGFIYAVIESGQSTYFSQYRSGAWVNGAAFKGSDGLPGDDGLPGADGLDLTEEAYGSMTLWGLKEGAGTNILIRMFRSQTVTAGGTLTYKIKAKAGQRGRLALFNSAGYAPFNIVFNLWTGVATIISGATVAAAKRLPNGSWELTATVPVVSAGTIQVQLTPLNETSTGAAPYRNGDGASSLYIKSAEAFLNGNASWATETANFSAAVWTKDNIALTAAAARFMGPAEPVNPGFGCLVGKKVTVHGNSLASQGQWTVPFANRTGCTLTNLGVAGASLGAASNGHSGSLGITNQLINTPVDAEIIIFDEMVNDFGAAAVPLGSVTDTTTATYAGAIRNAVEWCNTNRPAAKVFFKVLASGAPTHPTHSHAAGANTAGFTLRQYQTMTRDVCDLMGRPYLDMSRLGFSTLDSDENTGDGLHYDESGGMRNGNVTAAFAGDLINTGWLPAS